MANPIIKLKRTATTTNPSLEEGEVAVNTNLKQLYIGLGDGFGSASTAKFVLRPQALKVIFSDAPDTVINYVTGDDYTATIKPKQTLSGNKTFLLPNEDGTILTTGNIGSVITNAILNAISNAVAVVTENSPFITNLSLNSNGELVAVYSNNTTSVIGDVVDLDQPLDGGTF